MGVLNLTPDSFSDGGKFTKKNSGIKHALKLINDAYTGFESLRQHFASLTGDYDHFNNTYRSNLIFLHNKYYKETYGIVPNRSIDKSIRVVIGNLEIITRIGEDLQDYLDNNDVEIINHWYLEF